MSLPLLANKKSSAFHFSIEIDTAMQRLGADRCDLRPETDED